MIIRAATEQDIPAITAIYNEVIANTNAIYTETPLTPEDRAAWMRARQAQNYPVLIADADRTVIGIASFGDFRTWPSGYRYTVEHSVHVDAGQRGRGIGRALLDALIAEAVKLGKHCLIGAIDAENQASIALHARAGFERVAHFREVAWKNGRWLDAIFMQRFLDTPDGRR
jgi:L-amino acid N-acyltransferase YncA